MESSFVLRVIKDFAYDTSKKSHVPHMSTRILEIARGDEWKYAEKWKSVEHRFFATKEDAIKAEAEEWRKWNERI